MVLIDLSKRKNVFCSHPFCRLTKSLSSAYVFHLGAVYQAAELGKGFKVKKFVVKDANVYPIQVCFRNKAQHLITYCVLLIFY